MDNYFDFFNGKLKLKNGPGCYKITEDALWLLGALPLNQKSYLEVGCATGVISLLLKLKNKEAEIKAIDIQHEMIEQAINHSLVNKIETIDFIEEDLYLYEDKSFDCVFSNPPFFNKCDCDEISDKVRNVAYVQSDIAKFIQKMLDLVKDNGTLCFMGHCTTRSDVLNLLKGTNSMQEIELVSKENKTGKRFIYIVKKDSKDFFESFKVNTFLKDVRKSVLFECEQIKYK